jgi:DnaK suppressor protein
MAATCLKIARYLMNQISPRSIDHKKCGRNGRHAGGAGFIYHFLLQKSMEKAQLARFQEILTRKREELRRVLSKEESQDAHDFGRDEGDRANFSQSKEMTFRQKAQDRGLLVMVEGALSRIENGTFGECMSCGQEISSKRLDAVPWSRYCITCQELIAEAR